MKVLVVEDEKNLADGLRFNLAAEGYDAEVAPDGETALSLLLNEKREFDALVLDVMLPGVDGFSVAAKLRQKGNYVPILMLTARNRPEDVLRGFEAGADDYLPKPFELNIFLARLIALLRRREWFNLERDTPTNVYEVNGRVIDLNNFELQSDTQNVSLTLMEAKLLRYLIENAGQVVSRKTILEDVWELAEDTDTRAIDNFIVRLRKYLETDAAKPQHLLTVRGVGYRFIF